MVKIKEALKGQEPFMSFENSSEGLSVIYFQSLDQGKTKRMPKVAMRCYIPSL